MKKLGTNLIEHFWLVVLAPRVANWVPELDGILFFSLPEFDDILFSALGPIQGHQVQHLLVTWGRLKRVFLLLHQ